MKDLWTVTSMVEMLDYRLHNAILASEDRLRAAAAHRQRRRATIFRREPRGRPSR